MDSTGHSQKGAGLEALQYDSCDFCPFGARRNKFYYYPSKDYKALKESAERGHCQACAGTVKFLKAQKLEPVELFYALDENTPLAVILTFDNEKEKAISERKIATYEFFVKNKDPAGEKEPSPGLRLKEFKIPRLHAPSGDTSSKAAFDTLRHWISQCEEEHCQCQPEGDKTLPHRVLEIESSEPLRVRLVENCTRHEKYACLSHRWGKQTKPNSLNKQNLNLYKTEVPGDKLYPLVRDAIAAVIELNIHFIWIDCYCIVQDDPEDWEVQAANMGLIYENAFLTVSATISEDGSSMFSTWTGEFEAFHITEIEGESVYIRKQISHPCIVRHGEEHLTGQSLTRAWVFQERLLSNRFIHFIRGEIFWECRQSTWCECRSSQEQWERQRMRTARSIYSQDWDSIAQQYNGTQLSFEKDRLPALAGVARRYAECSGWTYLAGLWKEVLPSALSWEKNGWNEPRPLENVAPTWSWASLPRGKHVSIFGIGGSMPVVDYKINQTEADVYTSAKGAEITVEGSTLDLTVYKGSDMVLIGRHKEVFLEMRADFKTDPDDDTKFRAVPNGSRCLLLLLFDAGQKSGYDNVCGLLLMQQNSGADEKVANFERIGWLSRFDDQYLDEYGDYDEYCGGSFPPWSDPERPLNYPPPEWLLDRAKTRQVTLV